MGGSCLVDLGRGRDIEGYGLGGISVWFLGGKRCIVVERGRCRLGLRRLRLGREGKGEGRYRLFPEV